MPPASQLPTIEAEEPVAITKRPLKHRAKDGRDFSWQASYRDPAGRERTKTFARERDAKAWLTEIEHSKLASAYVDPVRGKQPFRQYAEQWRQRQMHRASSKRQIEQRLRLYVYPVLGEHPIAGIRPSDIQGLVQQLSQRLAPNSVSGVYATISSVFRAAVFDEVIPRSPCIRIRTPTPEPAKVNEVLEPAQVLALIDAAPERHRAAIVTAAGLGVRAGELLGLTLDRVDFLRRTVRIDRQLSDRAPIHLAPPKTSSSYRTLPLPEAVGKELAAHLASYPPHPELGLLFTGERGQPLRYEAFAEVFRKAKTKAGLPSWVTPHDLRHFYASALIRSGASAKVVQTRLGHASAKITLDVYGHLWPDEEDRTRVAIDAVLSPADIARTQETSQGPSGLLLVHQPS